MKPLIIAAFAAHASLAAAGNILGCCAAPPKVTGVFQIIAEGDGFLPDTLLVATGDKLRITSFSPLRESDRLKPKSKTELFVLSDDNLQLWVDNPKPLAVYVDVTRQRDFRGDLVYFKQEIDNRSEERGQIPRKRGWSIDTNEYLTHKTWGMETDGMIACPDTYFGGYYVKMHMQPADQNNMPADCLFFRPKIKMLGDVHSVERTKVANGMYIWGSF